MSAVHEDRTHHAWRGEEDAGEYAATYGRALMV